MPLHNRGPVTVLAAAIALIGATPAAAAEPRDIARDYLKANAKDYGVSSADVSETFVMSSHKTSGTGVTHVNLNQRHQGIEVFGGLATVNVGADGRVIFAGGQLYKLDSGSADATLAPADAVEAAAADLNLEAPSRLRVLGREGQETLLSDGGVSEEPIPAELGWWPTAAGLRLAYHVVIDDTSEAHLWSSAVDADTGEVLSTDDWTNHDNLDDLEERVGRQRDLAPAFQDAFAANSPTPVIDGSTYRVWAWPHESPNDAPSTLVGNPADITASEFGWHDTDEETGPDYVTTQGNNAHAYLDQDANNAPDWQSSPYGGMGLDFNYAADLTQHAQNYRDAAVVNLFYSNNMIHDILYRYGFDEVSGNFQANNYGNAPTSDAGDYVRAEAQDGNGTNNANFSTPAEDGGSPRMQMYVWPGSTTTFGQPNEIVVDGGPTFQAGWARFTPAATPAGTGNLPLIYGNTGCSDADYPPTVPETGWIAVVDGGTTAPACSYLQRVMIAESLGALGVVVAHNAAGANPPLLTGLMIDYPPGIPAVAVNQADGAALKAYIAASPTAVGTLRKRAAHPGIRDGDLENGIIIHEYGHGVSNRLTGGPKTVGCLTGNEQAGEGWSDFLAISLLLDPRLDNPEGSRGMGPYALFQPNRSGAGIRPRPYSRDMTIQPFTYDSIKTNGWLNNTSLALPHGLGHGWAATLWDVTWDLIDKHGFNSNVYGAWNTGGNNRAIQYVMDGLKMQGCGPGLVVARAAITAAAETRGGGDFCTVWASFARRGLGYSAVQGTTDRNDNTEAFDTHPSCKRNFMGPLAQPAINTTRAGGMMTLRFTADGYRGLDVLAKNQPYSRQIDCDTLQTITPGQTFITPRPYPIPTTGTLSVTPQGQFNYRWQTDAAWAGTCRELVATADTGRQYRAYFRFVT